MQIAHSFLAILAGFISVVGLMGIASFLLKRLTDAEAPLDPLRMAVNLAVALISAVSGGYVTARYSQANLLAHVLMLAIVVLLLGALSAVQMKGRQPTYYLLVMTAIPPLAVLAGGLLRLRQLGLHW